jgi:adenylate cyclase
MSTARGALQRAIIGGKMLYLPDWSLIDVPTFELKVQREFGVKSALYLPLLHDGACIGVLTLVAKRPNGFGPAEIALAESFRDQALIAIENTRLLNELRQRTTDLTEALEQQTATSEVLRVISSSPNELAPVFETMLANATRLCEANFGTLNLYKDGAFPPAAMHNVPGAYAEYRRLNPRFRVVGRHALARVAETGQMRQILDMRSDPLYLEKDPSYVAMVERAGARTMVLVPMVKDRNVIGVITIFRQEVRPFTDKQIALVQNFAAQAVIAIENTRLLNELRQRTDDLSESLDQQTATSEVLRVISSSPGQLEAVFQAMLENATRLCEAQFGFLFRYDGRLFNNLAVHNAPAVLLEFMEQRGAFLPPAGTVLHDLLVTRNVVHRADASAAQNQSAPVRLAGAKSFLAVPMFKNEVLVGAISIFRQEVRPFTDKQIELLRNFAAQAVIAIENARLLNDLNELNQQLEQRVADQVGEIERMGRLRRFLPPQVADLIVASGSEKQLESHRREVTALFCDLRGFTGFSESSDPEDVMALLRDYHAAIGEIIIKYSGTLERYAGDGVMVVFNDPVPVENPALQAVLMALEMRQAIGALIENWRRWGHDIGFGIGIAHGYATLGTIGFEGRFDYAAIGTVSNVASRLCDEAMSGQILITARVLTAIGDAVIVERIGEFALKGIRRPLEAHNVLALKSIS